MRVFQLLSMLTLALIGAAFALAAEPATIPGAKQAVDLAEAKEKEFKSTYDGTVQKYLILLPKDFKSDQPHDLLLGFHGHGSDRRQYMFDERGECAGARAVAARHQMIYVTPDYRASVSWMGLAAEADTVQLIAELKKTYRVGKVYIVGASMGGTAVLTFAVLHPGLVDGVSSQNGTANLLDFTTTVTAAPAAIKDAFGGRASETPEEHKKRDPGVYKKRSAEFHPEQLTMPIAFTVGGKDTAVPPDSVRRLVAALQKTNRHVLLIDHETGGHCTDQKDTETALEFVIAAVKRTPRGK